MSKLTGKGQLNMKEEVLKEEPTAMTIEDLHPEVQEVYRKMPDIDLNNKWTRRLAPFFQALTVRPKKQADVKVTTRRLRDASLRIYEPAKKPSGAGLLWIHGGGLVLGKAIMNDPLCNHFASKLGLTVVSVDYRLAPKHPYPAAIDDCMEAWIWFLNHCEILNVTPERIAVGGQSAGGGLAAALCQRIKDQADRQPNAQLLYYPMLDDRTIDRTDLTKIKHVLWNNNNNAYGWGAYLGNNAAAHFDLPPWSAPARCKTLNGLPPAWVGVGDKDLFLDEDTRYAKALREAGVECEFIKVPGAPHGFDAAVPNASISMSFQKSADAFLSQKLGLS